ncbi:SAM-dependent methyltransferase [Nocardia sputi]|uniref:SAM-dependent methyltransferase n=1 Tax=Nocardia sputi TaxID=2943705 RepID=UPI0020BF1A65|nr:SAM-dependent methyltransferase [Nocardia sputi]
MPALDITRPSIARVYDYSLRGKDNYAVDRAAFETVLKVAPAQREVSLANRRWLHRVVRYLAGPAGIDQFLDIGAGLPTVGNIHEVAQLENQQATVVYVDNDPLCVAHGRVLLEQNDRTYYLPGDLLEVGTLLENHSVRQYFDPDRPIGVLAGAVLHHLDDDLAPAQVMRELIDRLPTGSYVAITHFYDPGPENPEAHALSQRLEEAFVEGVGSGWYRTREEILAFFDGLELLPPGLVELDDWWPQGTTSQPGELEERLVARRTMRGAVGYKRPPLRWFPGTGVKPGG